MSGCQILFLPLCSRFLFIQLARVKLHINTHTELDPVTDADQTPDCTTFIAARMPHPVFFLSFHTWLSFGALSQFSERPLPHEIVLGEMQSWWWTWRKPGFISFLNWEGVCPYSSLPLKFKAWNSAMGESDLEEKDHASCSWRPFDRMMFQTEHGAFAPSTTWNLSLQLLVAIFVHQTGSDKPFFVVCFVISTQTDPYSFGRMTSLTRSFFGEGIQILYIPLFFQEC